MSNLVSEIAIELSDWTKIASVAESVVKILAIFAAGLWAFWRYVYQGEFRERVGFSVDINFVAIVDEFWLVELIASVDNKGLVTHKIDQFTFHLRCIYPDDPVADADARANWQTNIPQDLKKGSWLPETPKWGHTFIRPGVCNKYTYVTVVPRKARAALLTGRFTYSKNDAFHTAVKLAKVPPDGTEVEAIEVASNTNTVR